jgi:hypothetical protein
MIKALLLKLLVRLLKGLAPGLAIQLLAYVDPTELADKVRPAIRQVFQAAGPDWQRAFKEAWAKMDAFMDDLLNDPSVGG